MNLPDHSTLNRFRNWLIKEGLADELYQQINQQLAHNQLKVEKAQTAIVDATIIQTAGGKLKKSIEINENEEVIQTPASKDKDARWTIKSKHCIWATNFMRVPMKRGLLSKFTLRQRILLM